MFAIFLKKMKEEKGRAHASPVTGLNLPLLPTVFITQVY